MYESFNFVVFGLYTFLTMFYGMVYIGLATGFSVGMRSVDSCTVAYHGGRRRKLSRRPSKRYRRATASVPLNGAMSGSSVSGVVLPGTRTGVPES